MKRKLRLDELIYSTGVMDFLTDTDKINMNETIKDASVTFSNIWHNNVSVNEAEDDQYFKQNNFTSVYSFYPTELLTAGAVLCVLLSIFGTTGNFISILALVKKKRLRNPTTAFIVNLCVADMLYCSFTMPLTAVTFAEKNWNYGVALCKIFALVKFTNGIVSIFTLVAITLNRYILIVHPKLYSTLYSKRNTAVFIFCLWIFPLTLICFPLFDVWGTLKYSPRVGDCGVMDHEGKSPRRLIFVLVMILPSILFVACYTRIYFVVKKTVRNSHRKEEIGAPRITKAKDSSPKNEYKFSSVYVYLRDKKEFRVLKIIFVVFIVYTISIFPLALIKIFKKERELHVMTISAFILYFSSSVINPVIYIIMSREYRIAYKELFLCKK